MKTKYGLHGKLKATKGKGPELATILLQAARLVSTAEGCHIYLVSRDLEEPDAVWVTEVWDSKVDHDESLKREEVRALIGKAIPLLDGQPERGLELEVIGGVGI